MIAFTVPIKTVNEANGSHGHWSVKAGRRKKQREATRAIVRYLGLDGNPPDDPPFVVKLTRHSAGLLDTDALPLSLKSIRDEIADWLGVTDGPTDSRVTWTYDQIKGKHGVYAVSVEVTGITDPSSLKQSPDHPK